ncbi:FHA domain-containing protein [Kitasatospora sp. NBC_00315]|uniref:FHA domain-containing protein n=1 Tax=Kitasatospora sp. NBC_00315 TaxID=2975963 RepID=UPI00324E5C17
MPICPRGHESQAEDWCDFCGFPMTPPPGLAVPGRVAPAPAQPAPAPARAFPDVTEGLTVCPICRSPQTGRYCEECGYDYDLSSPSRRQPPAPAPASLAPPAPPAPAAPGGIPAAYGGTRAPQQAQQAQQAQQPPRPQQPGAPSGGYGYPQPSSYEPRAEYEKPAPYERPTFEKPAPYEPPAPYEQAPYEQPRYEQAPYEQPQYEQRGYEQPGAYPEPAPYQEPGGYQEPGRPYEQPGGYRQPDGFERPGAQESAGGPVYAQPGPTPQGEEFGTSFKLAPPLVPGSARTPAHGVASPGAEQTRGTWMAVVSADREYFTDMMARSGPEAAGLFFPPYCPERRIPLTGRGQLRIGRRSQQRGTVPEIDLSVPPEDPGASHQHALLAEQADGSWVLVDQDSTNGTTVNGGAESVAPHTAIPLNDGDRVHVGAWTTITLHRS